MILCTNKHHLVLKWDGWMIAFPLNQFSPVMVSIGPVLNQFARFIVVKWYNFNMRAKTAVRWRSSQIVLFWHSRCGTVVKGKVQVHPKMKILSFINSHVVPKLWLSFEKSLFLFDQWVSGVYYCLKFNILLYLNKERTIKVSSYIKKVCFCFLNFI